MTDLAELAADVEWIDHGAATQAHDALITVPGLGQLADLVEWVAGVQGRFPVATITRPRLVIAAADHPIAGAGVSAYRPRATDDAVAAIQAGTAAVAALAELAGAGVRIERLADASGRIDLEPAMSAEATSDAVRRGAAVVDEEVDSGADLLIAANIGTGSTTAAAAIISVLTGVEPAKVTGRGGSGIDDTAWMHKVGAIRDARRRGWPDRGDPMALLASVGGPDIAALAGLLLRAAARRTPVLLDGVVAAAAALLANSEQPRAAGWWWPAQRTGEPAQTIALSRFDRAPVLDLAVAAGDGRGGLLALTMVRAGLALSARGKPRTEA